MQTMKSSPYARIFEKKIQEWEEWLNYTLEFSDFWVKVQSVWIYGAYIFIWRYLETITSRRSTIQRSRQKLERNDEIHLN